MLEINNLKEPYVLVLIGPPNCGKTTFLKSIRDVEIISRDQLLIDISGSDDYSYAYNNTDKKIVDAELNNRFISVASSKVNAAVDMTNMTSRRRKHTLSYFKGYYKVAVIFPILDWDEYVKRNNKRREEENKYIPEQVIKDMISSYNPIDESEGFDLITNP